MAYHILRKGGKFNADFFSALPERYCEELKYISVNQQWWRVRAMTYLGIDSNRGARKMPVIHRIKLLPSTLK